MQVLLDQGTPAPLRAFLLAHQVSTAYERGWSALKNGELLQAAELAGFLVLVTTDTNPKYQQNGVSPQSCCRSEYHELAPHQSAG